MTQGYSGSYAINGIDLTLQPSEGKWTERNILNFDGFGHPIYPGVSEFEMRFVLSSPSDFSQLTNFFNSAGSTGTFAVDLPQFGASGYLFFRYSGCVLQEPYFEAYFSENHQEVVMRISNIRT